MDLRTCDLLDVPPVEPFNEAPTSRISRSHRSTTRDIQKLRQWPIARVLFEGASRAEGGASMNEATIGSALTERRQELGITRVQAADKVGMSRTTYSSYERDTQRPSVDVFPALAAFLHVTIEEFLTLYGATAIAALRPSLEQMLSEPDDSSNHLVETSEEQTVVDETYWLGPAAAIPDLPVVPEVPDVPDVPKIPDVPDVPDVLEVPEVPEAPEVPDVPEDPNFMSGEGLENELKLKRKKKKGKKKKRN